MNSEAACDKWIEIINSATIFSKFWSILMQKSSKVSEYFWKLNQEKLEIKAEDSETVSTQEVKEETKHTEETEKKESANNKKSMQSEKGKGGKKERRKNPYTQRKHFLI